MLSGCTWRAAQHYFLPSSTAQGRPTTQNVFLCFVQVHCFYFVWHFLFLWASTLPHWCQKPRACAGWWPAAVCESRPSQGQAEPLCYPLLPCVPPGFLCSLLLLSNSFLFLSTQLQLFKTCTPLSGSSSCSCSQAPREKQNQVEKQPPLAALRATYNADPLSKLLCSPFPLAPLPSLPLSALLLGKSILIFSLFLLPQSRPSSTTNSYLVFRHLLWDRKRQRERREQAEAENVAPSLECVQLKLCLYVSTWWWWESTFSPENTHTHTCLLCYLNAWGVHLHSQSAHLHDCKVGAAVACLALSQWSLLAAVSTMFSNQTWEEWWCVCVCWGGTSGNSFFSSGGCGIVPHSW